MYILGINSYHPDSSACLVRDGQLIAAAEEERFNRIKHWAGFPGESIKYCLSEGNIGLEDLDFLILNRNHKANFYKKILFVLRYWPSPSLIGGRLFNIFKIKEIKDALGREFSVPKKKIKAKIYTAEHHRAHLASSFFVSPFDKAAVVSLDGFGDFTSCMVARGQNGKITPLYEVNFPHSLGLFYTALTQFLGFKKYGDEYKVMGLSAFGQPKYLDKLEDVLVLKPEGKFVLNLDYFSFHKKRECMLWNNTEPFLEDVYSGRLIQKLGRPRGEEEDISGYHCDLAASLQVAYEKAFFHILNHAHKIIGGTKLCLAGGCALNSVANGKIFDRTPFREIYIQPGSSDAGGAIGAAYFFYYQILSRKREFIMKNAFWGPAFDGEKIIKAIEAKKDELEKMNCVIKKIEGENNLCQTTAKSIADGKIVGWFQGRMEWGPRALGNRSILADPRRPEMKDILNERIKRREWFRPFAPSILLERTKEYFKIDYPDPFMLKVYPMRENKKNLIPAVTHVDGTGRLQTVNEEENPLYWRLIKEFEKITGIPVLLNTSFNENEPIVCTPLDALECFLRTKMDFLVLGSYIIGHVKG